MTIDNEQFTDMIARVEKSIHRIDLYIHIVLFKLLLPRLKDEYKFLGKSPPPPGKNNTSFRFNSGHHGSDADFAIQMYKKEGDTYPSFFISIINHTIEFRKELLKIIKSLISKDSFLSTTHPNNACSVYCVESPLDFFPKKVDDLHKVFNYLVDGLFIKYGRRGEHFVIDSKHSNRANTHRCPTLYIGKRNTSPNDDNNAEWDSNVNNDLHGLRVYYRPTKEKPRYIRLEYAANKTRLSVLGLRGLETLPDITPDKIRPLEFVLYRKRSKHELHKAIMNKLQGRNHDRKFSTLAVKTMIHRHKNLVWHRLHHIDKNENEDPETWKKKLANRKKYYPYSFLETAAEVDAFKEIKKKIGLTHAVSIFFPEDKNKLSTLKSMVRYP